MIIYVNEKSVQLVFVTHFSSPCSDSLSFLHFHDKSKIIQWHMFITMFKKKKSRSPLEGNNAQCLFMACREEWWRRGNQLPRPTVLGNAGKWWSTSWAQPPTAITPALTVSHLYRVTQSHFTHKHTQISQNISRASHSLKNKYRMQVCVITYQRSPFLIKACSI